jgi:hypothetical protein
VAFKTVLETRMAIPENATAAINKTMSEDAPIRDSDFYEYNKY